MYALPAPLVLGGYFPDIVATVACATVTRATVTRAATTVLYRQERVTGAFVFGRQRCSVTRGGVDVRRK
jgi:hypothetical protein